MAAQVNVPFALAPALVGQAQLIDYSTSEGVKVYKTARAELPSKFDVTSENLRSFLEHIQNRAREQGWNDIFDIPEDPVNAPLANTTSLLTAYGTISLERIQLHAQQYVALPTRAAQESFQVYQCLMNSLTDEGMDKVTLRSEDYFINDIPAGVPLLKVIIQEAYVDTNATTRQIRENLSNLDKYIVDIKSDITQMNTYVRTQLRSLHARGEDTQDLLTNLFKGYMAASDKEFRDYIKGRQEEYDDNRTTYTSQQLMTLANNKYTIRVQDHLWNAPSEADEKIIALESEISQLKTSNKSSNFGTPKRDDRPRNRPRPDWMKNAPKSDESSTKHVNKKQYWWCPTHMAWVRHKPQDCEGRGINKPEGGNPPTDTQGQIRLNQALAELAEATSDEEEE
jgi:hypothetical protein